MPGITEAQWQRVVVDLAHALGFRTYHARFAIGSDRHFPDLVIAGKGRVVFAELKSERGRLTAGQAEYLDWLRAEGLEAHVWHPADFDRAVAVLTGGGDAASPAAESLEEQSGAMLAKPAAESQKARRAASPAAGGEG